MTLWKICWTGERQNNREDKQIKRLLKNGSKPNSSQKDKPEICMG